MRRLLRIWPYLGILVGIAVLLAFPLSEAVDAYERGRIAESIDTTLAETDDSVAEELLAQAVSYNRQIAGLTPKIDPADILPYGEQLSLSGGNTAFAVFKCPKLALTMPIYHGTDSAVLSAGAGHVEGTSLPVGGESTHCAISAHTGLANMRGFDEIDTLVEGDVFGIKCLGEMRCYRVTGSEVVEADAAGCFTVAAGMDLCTLVTCTPYGINTERLLVHAERCEVPDGFEDSPADLAAIATGPHLASLILGLAALVVLIAAACIRMLLSRRPSRLEDEGGSVASGNCHKHCKGSIFKRSKP